MTPSVRTPNRDLATLKYRYSLRRGLFSEIDAVVLAGRPSYVARTKFDTLKLLENLDPDGGPDPGATSIGWWTRTERFRTLARLCADVGVSDPFVIPIYQVIAAVSGAMHDRGVGVSRIAKHFGVDHHTAAKALRWFRSR